MHRFFVEISAVKGSTITLSKDDTHHLIRVLRIKNTELFEICDGAGTDFIVKLESMVGENACCKIIDSQKSVGENAYGHTMLFQGMTKGNKMETITQKAVELGVGEIIPFISKRSIIKIKSEKQRENQRLNRIAYEAAKQSKRGIIPKVSDTIDFINLEKYTGVCNLLLVAYECEKLMGIKQALALFSKELPITIGVIIGPEGGFEVSEIERIKTIGGIPISLGARILRTETAGADLLSKLNLYYE